MDQTAKKAQQMAIKQMWSLEETKFKENFMRRMMFACKGFALKRGHMSMKKTAIVGKGRMEGF